MRDATRRFFECLSQRGFEPLLEKFVGTLRFDVVEEADTEHRLVIIDRGRVRVVSEDREADAALGIDSELLEQIIAGQENAVAALLRGDVTIAGDLRLVLAVERLFPAQSMARGMRRVLTRGTR